MSESSLAVTYTELKQAVAHYLGYGLTVASWSADQSTKIDMAIKSGLRQFYFPPKIFEQRESHKWSFLTPVTTLDVVGPYSTGTVSIGQYATGTVTVFEGDCTLLGGIWPSWVSAGDTLTIGETVYAVATRDDGTGLTVTGDDVSEATAYTIVTDDTTNAVAVLAGGTWPSAWTEDHGSIVIDNTEYAITTRDSDTELTLSAAWAAADYIEGEDYSLKHDGNYDLPDEYAGMTGSMVVESTNYQPPITIVGEGVIRNSRQQNPQNVGSGSSSPFYAAIRPKVQVTTTGQRFEIMFYPLPSTACTLSYAMRVLPQMLDTDTDVEYPYGGATHSETIKASCMAAAEVQVLDAHGPLWEAYKEELSSSITSDNAMNSQQYFGYNGDNSDLKHRPVKGGYRGRNPGLVTYNGEL